MNDESTAIRHEPRFTVRKLDATAVTVAIRQSKSEREPKTIQGVAADVSATGIRMALDGAPPKGATVSVHFQIPEIGIDLMLEGIIRWIQPKDRDSWWVGCMLDSPIPSASLEMMASTAIMDRRQDERLPASCKAQAKWELSSDITSVEVTDYSLGGCSITTDEPVELASDRMMLMFESENGTTQLPVRIIWSRAGTKFGCAFLSNRGFLQIREFVESKSQTLERVQRETSRKNRLRRSAGRWRWIAASAVILIALQAVSMIADGVPAVGRIRDGLYSALGSILPGNDPNNSNADTVTVKEADSASDEPDA